MRSAMDIPGRLNKAVAQRLFKVGPHHRQLGLKLPARDSITFQRWMTLADALQGEQRRAGLTDMLRIGRRPKRDWIGTGLV